MPVTTDKDDPFGCPHCGNPDEESFIGNIDRLLFFDCTKCGKRFWYELVPNHNCTNVLASQKRQWRERKAS